jgi:hypothetical protein
MGAADVLWERAGQRLGGTAIMEELHQQTVKAAQDALGEDCYAALFRDGAGRARQLGISKRTVDAHLEHIFGKLGISSRVQLATGLSPTAPSPDRPPPPPGPPGP